MDCDCQQRLAIMEGNIKSMRRELRQYTEWQETVSSPTWKRILWTLQGWRWKRLGRWYGGA